MAALTADRQTPYREGNLVTYPMAAAAKIYGGGMVSIDGGYTKAMVKEADKLFAGRAEESVDNSSGVAGAKTVQVRRGVAFRWANSNVAADTIAQANVGAKAYALDDQTVSKVAAGATEVGEILEVDSEGVWVG